MDLVNSISLTMGAAWASGINLYAAMFMLGYLGMTGNIVLPPDLQVLSDPLVLLAAGFMYCIEFFADKTPGVDTGWDALHTFIRIPAGAVMAMQAVGDVSPAAQVAALIGGGALAATSHAVKASTRVLINTSPEPVTNWTASFAEDLAVIGGLWASLHYPLAFIAFIIAYMLFSAWLLPRLWRGIKLVGQRIARWFGSNTAAPVVASEVLPARPKVITLPPPADEKP